MDWQTLRVGLKVGIAVGLAYLLTYGERSQYALYAVLTAALIVGENFGEDLNQSLVRLVGTLLGAVVGVAFLVALGVDVWAVVGAAVISRLIKLEQLSRVTLAVCMVTLLLHPDRVAAYGMYRLLNTFIGAGIGLRVSILVWPVRAEVAATRAVTKLLSLSADVLLTVGKPPSAKREDATDRTEQQLSKVFKAIRDARREGQVFRTSATATAERAILGGQVGLGGSPWRTGASGWGRTQRLPLLSPPLPPLPDGWPSARRLSPTHQPTARNRHTHEPLSELLTPPADADLNATEGVLMAGVIGELRVIASALAVLERVTVQATKHEIADQVKEDASNEKSAP